MALTSPVDISKIAKVAYLAKFNIFIFEKIFNILGDKVETVTPWLVDGILASNKTGATVAWLTGPKAGFRFMTAAFNKREL